MELRDRLARFGVGQSRAALSAQGRRIVVADPGEITGDLVRDVTCVLTGMGARRRAVWGRAVRAVTAARRGPISRAWAG